LKILICGAGQVGWQIARQLSSENNDVTIIDNQPELVKLASETLNVNGVVGFASYPDVLENAGAQDSDMIIAATHSDEVNMVICQIAHSVFEIPRKIARLRAQSYLTAIYSDLYRRDHMPIDVVISPELEVAKAALQRLQAPSAFETEYFLDGDAQMIGIVLDESCPVLNTPLRQLSELFSTLRALVIGIRRKGLLFVPRPNDQLFSSDQVYIFTNIADLDRTLEIFGKVSKKRERVIIIGGGNVGLNVARELEMRTDRVRVKIIEKSLSVAEKAADILEKTIVLHGDGLDLDLLEEANVQSADAILAVTDDDKTNLLVATQAKAAGCPITISLINDPNMTGLMEPLGISAFVNPRATTVSSILRHIRHGRVRRVYSIGDGEAEVIEAQVLSSSPIAGKEIKEIDFPEGVIVGGIKKGNELIKPVGNTIIQQGDVITIFSLARDVPNVEALLQVSIDFF
jgi:trk system potassium uptake protein TrkA|tara:strand:+ start:382 stop:1758 length:1377 start_codon:yes stop_codon:yes gene_type:complete